MVDYDWNCKKVDGKNFYHPRVIERDDFFSSKFRTSFNDPRNPLQLVSANGWLYYAKTPEQKISLILEANPSSNIYFIWMGKFSSDTFQLPNSLRKQALKILGHSDEEEKLAKLNAKVEKLEAEYKWLYSNLQERQAALKGFEEDLLNTKTERDMLKEYLHPSHSDSRRWDREYEAKSKRYVEPVADDNDYWH